jgi:hypothetical protein
MHSEYHVNKARRGAAVARAPRLAECGGGGMSADGYAACWRLHGALPHTPWQGRGGGRPLVVVNQHDASLQQALVVLVADHLAHDGTNVPAIGPERRVERVSVLEAAVG